MGFKSNVAFVNIRPPTHYYYTGGVQIKMQLIILGRHLLGQVGCVLEVHKC